MLFLTFPVLQPNATVSICISGRKCCPELQNATLVRNAAESPVGEVTPQDWPMVENSSCIKAPPSLSTRWGNSDMCVPHWVPEHSHQDCIC